MRRDSIAQKYRAKVPDNEYQHCLSFQEIKAINDSEYLPRGESNYPAVDSMVSHFETPNPTGSFVDECESFFPAAPEPPRYREKHKPELQPSEPTIDSSGQVWSEDELMRLHLYLLEETLTSLNKGNIAASSREEMLDWLMTDGKRGADAMAFSFNACCYFAGMCPDELRELTLNALSRMNIKG